MEQAISDAVIQKFGYSKKSAAVDSRKRVVSVEGFESLQIKQPPTFVGDQIRELDREIEEANNPDRLLNIDYGKYVRQRTRQYNYIVTYKHLKEKNSQETRQILKLLPKTPQEIIFERIEEVKKQLQAHQNQTLSRQYDLNNTLNGLFKDFRRADCGNKRLRTTSRLNNRSLSVANQTTDSLLIKELTARGRTSNISAFSSTTPKSGRLHFIFKREKVRAANLLDPFPVKSNYDESKKVQTKIKQEKQVMDLWRLRVEEHRDTIRGRIQLRMEATQRGNKSRVSNASSQMDSSRRKSPQPRKVESRMNAVLSRSGASSLDIQKAEVQNAADRKKRKSILTTIIKKRSNRYVRHKGMKGLMAFDPNKAASDLLEGRADLKKSSVEERLSASGQAVDTSLYELPVLEGPPKKLQNISDYTAEYKNEKINMSLKTKKR